MVNENEPSNIPEIPHSANELPELITAVTYWTTAVSKHDKNLPTWKVKAFQEELFQGLKKRCEGHWYPDNPDRGQGYRALICAERVDTLLLEALRKAQLSLDLRQICGEEVVMYVDPGNVSVRQFPPYARGSRNTLTHTLFSNSTTTPSSSTNPTSTSPTPSTSPPTLMHNNIHRPIVQLA